MNVEGIRQGIQAFTPEQWIAVLVIVIVLLIIFIIINVNKNSTITRLKINNTRLKTLCDQAEDRYEKECEASKEKIAETQENCELYINGELKERFQSQLSILRSQLHEVKKVYMLADLIIKKNDLQEQFDILLANVLKIESKDSNKIDDPNYHHYVDILADRVVEGNLHKPKPVEDELAYMNADQTPNFVPEESQDPRIDLDLAINDLSNAKLDSEMDIDLDDGLLDQEIDELLDDESIDQEIDDAINEELDSVDKKTGS